MRSVDTVHERIYVKTPTRRTGPPADTLTAGPGAISTQASPPPRSLGAAWRLTNARPRPPGACPACPPALPVPKAWLFPGGGGSLCCDIPQKRPPPHHCERLPQTGGPSVLGSAPLAQEQPGGRGRARPPQSCTEPVLSGAREEGLVPDSPTVWRLARQGRSRLRVSARVGLTPPSTKAHSKLTACWPVTWSKLVTGAWCVCTEESHADE